MHLENYQGKIIGKSPTTTLASQPLERKEDKTGENKELPKTEPSTQIFFKGDKQKTKKSANCTLGSHSIDKTAFL